MVITISREYAAYGSTVARSLSQRLGIEYYDEDFIRMTSKMSGYSEEDVSREGESMSSGDKFINSFLSTTAYNSSYDEIFLAQKKVILELAKKEPCIMVGRCSNIIRRESGIRSFDVFLHADHAFRRSHALDLKENGKMEIDRYIDRCDHWRKTYYHAYTGYEMGDYRNYDISIDIGRLGVEKTVDLLESLTKDRIGD